MSYRVKEIFYSLQGEGVHAGQAALFCRFSGCNLWSGKDADRSQSPCSFCDTDFMGTDGPGGGLFLHPEDLTAALRKALPPKAHTVGFCRHVILTGGEPSLQVDERLLRQLHDEGFIVAIETNGTCDLPPGIDWTTVSPKAGTRLLVTQGDELKLVYPQENAAPEDFDSLDFKYFCLQPKNGPDRDENTRSAVQYCLDHPKVENQHTVTQGVGYPLKMITFSNPRFEGLEKPTGKNMAPWPWSRLKPSLLLPADALSTKMLFRAAGGAG